MKKKVKPKSELILGSNNNYARLLTDLVELLEQARHVSARSVNAIMTASYWEIGRRIVEFEQAGARRAQYGERLLERLSADMSSQLGRGFSIRNLRSFRGFYLSWPIQQTLSAESSDPAIRHTPSAESRAELIVQTVSGLLPPTPKRAQTASAQSSKRKSQTAAGESGVDKYASPSRTSDLSELARRFPLPWSQYVKLLSVNNPQARAFYETESLGGGWSVRQLDRQISTMFYERTARSRNKAAMLRKGELARAGERLTPEEEIKDPLVLEFLGLRDEYSESDLEEALIRHIEAFLLELGNDWAFVARQKRLRIGDEWYRLDLMFFHRRLRCLIIIDLKVGKFTHADAGQMNLYLNYARQHWTHPDENPPVGLILCTKADGAVAHYALGNLHNKVLAAEYRLALPDERLLVEEIEKTRRTMARQKSIRGSR